MPRSAPLASASLIVCFTRSGPMESATTSPPCFSFSRRASSSAKLSGSFISKLMSVSRIHVPPSAIWSGASLAGTCLMQTMMFKHSSRGRGELFVPALEEKRGVGAAEAERIRQRVFERGLARLVGHVVQIAFRVGVFVIDCRRQNLVAQRKHADAGLEPAGAAEQVAGHGFGRADRNLLRVLAKDALHGG